MRRGMMPLLALAMIGALDTRVKVGRTTAPRPGPPLHHDLTPRDRLEMDLMHAEDRLQRARTPGARRKAQRTVDALRRRLAEA